MRIPSKKDCFRMICEMEMMAHIMIHSLQVCRVALFFADRPAFENTGLNRNLIQASALLHDITKTRSIRTREDHAETGAMFIRERGYPEVASVVGQHVRLNDYTASDPINEAEIVSYADKRVLHDQVVTLDERMIDIKERYIRTKDQEQRIKPYWEKVKQAEKRIFSGLKFIPDDLKDLIGPEDFSDDLSLYQKMCGE